MSTDGVLRYAQLVMHDGKAFRMTLVGMACVGGSMGDNEAVSKN
jgi:hypothetical protein